MEPTFTDASNNLGNLLRTRGDVEEAVEFFQRAGSHVTCCTISVKLTSTKLQRLTPPADTQTFTSTTVQTLTPPSGGAQPRPLRTTLPTSSTSAPRWCLSRGTQQQQLSSSMPRGCSPSLPEYTVRSVRPTTGAGTQFATRRARRSSSRRA
jgi:hypothetical protein